MAEAGTLRSFYVAFVLNHMLTLPILSGAFFLVHLNQTDAFLVSELVLVCITLLAICVSQFTEVDTEN